MKTFKQFDEARLSAAQRRALPDKDFALPGKGEGPKGKQAGSYPIPDEKHARSALSLVSQHGTPEEKAKVRAKVAKKFPGIQQEEVGISSSAAMDKARKEAQLKAKEEAAVKKAKKVKEEVEAAVEYFYEQGINEEGIDLIIEDVGLDDFVTFVEFIHDETIFLNEEEGRSARKMNVRTKAKLKKDVAAIKADKSDVVARSTPKDVLSRARTERAFKKRKLAKPAAKKEAPAKKVSKKDYDGDGKKETPKQEHRGVRNKKITKAVAKAKPAQPKKPASKEGLRAKIKSAYEAGVKRHRKATQPVRVFHKGMKAGAKKAVKFAKDVKKVVGEAKVDTGSAEAKASARNKRNTPPGKDYDFDNKVFITRKPGESLESARTRKRREAHSKKRGMKEDKALDIVRQRIIKKHGEGAIYDAKRDKPSEADKKKAAAERKKRDADKAKAFADRAKKAGYKSTQDYANVVARYGSEDNMKKGRGLGT